MSRDRYGGLGLNFRRPKVERTQEFTLGCSAEPGGPLREIVRQQWSFSPHGSTSEVEDYRVDLDSARRGHAVERS
jgi:hypothetical protein